ncbi:MAG: Zn-dependent hydrolase [Leptospiraceae bacterium]|nr:Zn-dependent hydrolase [Leptospiraceae bacterium]MCB1315106.1 Zn-dependent hydrolase [Leptospiraceae bacterium]MCB1322508.1 Zn-dependent hydrolase [Leptospiraceae bacterium]
MSVQTDLKINFSRLRDDIEELSHIGRDADRGIYRMAFSDADMQARQWLLHQMKQAGMEARLDGAANVFGRVNHREGAPAVMTGSHLDTVPAGGHLDGALGVLVGLECLRRVQEEKINTRYPMELVAFSDEEGRFGGMLGSQAICGEITPHMIHTASDLKGITLMDAMREHNMDGMQILQARRNPQSVHAFLELHIEQGPVLDRMGMEAGIVEFITGLFKWSVRLIGAADHAGTTPMDMRRDSLGGLAEFAGEFPRILEEHGSKDSKATIGRVELFPGSANTVPGQVEFSLDVRDTDPAVLDDLAEAFRRTLSALARRRQLMFEFDILSEITPVPCAPDIIETIARAAEDLHIKAHRMPSGAAHDAQMMAKLAPTGMIFVPSKDGRSHSPAEWSHWEDIEKGANLALHTLLRLAEAEQT